MSPPGGSAPRAAPDGGRWTVLSILRTTARFLEEKAVDESRLSAEWLLADVLDCGRLDLYLQHDRPLESEELDRYRAAVRRRAAGEPVQYITGTAPFRGLHLADRTGTFWRPGVRSGTWYAFRDGGWRASSGWSVGSVRTGERGRAVRSATTSTAPRGSRRNSRPPGV